MTSYPINFSYDRDGQMIEGFASTAADAVAKIQADRGAEWKVLGAELETREVGATCRTAAEFEKHWAAEIEAGWVRVKHVYGGFVGEATFWATREEEAADEAR